jgi:hypothetical protein
MPGRFVNSRRERAEFASDAGEPDGDFHPPPRSGATARPVPAGAAAGVRFLSPHPPLDLLGHPVRPLGFDPAMQPMLQIIVDTEEEFDWSKPFDRSSNAVENVKHQVAAHRIFVRYGAKPTYVLDYPVSSQPMGYGPMRELLDEGLCEIGAHLQPWVNPPFVEETNAFHSFPGNLPHEIERQKLRVLTETIERNLGRRPVIYRAGRYGLGRHSLDLLEETGYEIDASVLPSTDLRRTHGPDFSAFRPDPFWFGRRRRLLGIPLSVGYTGVLSAYHGALYPLLDGALGDAWRGKAIASRLRLLDRIALSPEGITLREQMRLTRHLLARGHRIFNLSYHSPSLVPGNTPYVRTRRELDLFLERIEQFLDFFVNEVKGRLVTPLDVKAMLDGTGGVTA